LTDDIIVHKIKLIQAEADHIQVQAEAGNVSREMNDAMAEFATLDERSNAAKTKANELSKVATKNLTDAGKSEEETAELLNVNSLVFNFYTDFKVNWRYYG
jgi:hypothetical protein